MADPSRAVPHAPEMVVRLRPDGSLTSVNEAFGRLFGVEPSQVMGRRLAEFVEARDVKRLSAALESLGPDNRTATAQVRAATGRMPPAFVRWVLLALFDTGDRLLEVHGFGIEITRERQMEAATSHLAAIVASADDAIASKTLQGIVTSWNPAAERMFGYAASEMIGRSIALIIPPERLHEETEILAQLARGERIQHFQTQRLHKSGRLLDVSITISPMRDAQGRVIGASKIVRDVTDQRRAQDELETSLRSLETLYRLADLVGQAATRQDVYEAALDALVAGIGGDRASILLFDAEGVMRFTAWRSSRNATARPWKAIHPGRATAPARAPSS